VIAGLFIPLAASAKLSNPGNAEVSFTALGPAGMKIVGTENELQVSDNGPAVNVAVPVEVMVRTLICMVTCSVYLPRCVALPVPVRSKKRVGGTTVPVSTAFTVPLNGVSAAAALTATVASDTAKATTSPTNSG
jgi:hypothetical protein